MKIQTFQLISKNKLIYSLLFNNLFNMIIKIYLKNYIFNIDKINSIYKKCIKMPKNEKKLQNKFFINYFSNIKEILEKLDHKKLIRMSNFIENRIKSKKQIFVAGNGGSASVANHFLCDFNKGIKVSSRSKLKPKVHSLNNSIELITAISNDISYKNIFDFQLDNYANQGDIIFIFSCSGTSKNIINLIKKANSMKLDVVFITGFLNKKIKSKVKFHYDFGCKNYGITEDMFSSFMHVISQWIRFKYSNYNKKNIL